MSDVSKETLLYSSDAKYYEERIISNIKRDSAVSYFISSVVKIDQKKHIKHLRFGSGKYGLYGNIKTPKRSDLKLLK